MAVAKRPLHIVFIVADDLGWHDVGFRNKEAIYSPHINQLAKDGVVLHQYYVHGTCTPSRATFMTGRWPSHHTLKTVLDMDTPLGLPLTETLIPQKLNQAGYRSYMVGKWHLGFLTWAHTPTFRGFEYFMGFYGGGQNYNRHMAEHAYDFREDATRRCGRTCSRVAWELQGEYSTHVFTRQAINIIERHDAHRAPMFLVLSFQAVHFPRMVPKEYRDIYTGKFPSEARQIFAGMLTCMDEGIGNVTRALARAGMLEDSVIIFTTDNGGPSLDSPGLDYTGSSNYPLRGGKHSIWEGGTRGVALVWAGVRTRLIPEHRRGIRLDDLMHGADWFPTLCSLAGILDNCEKLELDGVDQGSVLFGEGSRASRRTEVFYDRHDDAPDWFYPWDTAIRDADGWKLIQGWGGRPNTWTRKDIGDEPETCVLTEAECHIQPSSTDVTRFRSHSRSNSTDFLDSIKHKAFLLYNVDLDPREAYNVAAEQPEVVERLWRRLLAHRKTAVKRTSNGAECPPYVPEEHGQIWEPWCDDQFAGLRS